MHTVRFTREAVTFLVCQLLVGLIAAWALLSAVPVAAQDIAPTLREVRAAYPTPMSKAQLSEMLNRAISQHPGWAFLRKDSGNNCPTPYPGISVSCDWIVHAGTRWGYDVLRDQEGAAVIVESGGEAIAAGAELVYPWPAGGTSPVPQPPAKPPEGVPGVVPIDYERLSRTIREEAVRVVLEQMQADRQAWEAQAASVIQRLDAMTEQVRRHDEEPSWLTRRLKDAKTYVAIAGVLGGYFAKGATK